MPIVTDSHDQTSPAIQLACADSTFPRLSHQVALAVISDLGFGAVDICVYEESRQLPTGKVLGAPALWADDVRRSLDIGGLAVSDVFVILRRSFDRLAVNHPDSAEREAAWDLFNCALEFTERVGGPGLTILPGMPFVDEDPDGSIALAASELQRRAEAALERGVTLSVEPHVGSIAETPETCARLLDLAPDLLITLDYSHFIYHGIDQAAVDPLLPRTRHLHARQAQPAAMQLPALEGTIDFEAVVDRLFDFEYRGYIALEYQWDEWMDFNRVDCISETDVLARVLRQAIERRGTIHNGG